MIVDTDVIIWYMRNNDRAVSLLHDRIGFSISVVTYMELLQGLRNKQELRALKTALKIWRTTIIHIDETISTRAMVYQERYGLSHAMRLADALIAATAISHQKVLVTGNIKHYQFLSELDLNPFDPIG